MKTATVLEHYKNDTYAVAAVLGISRQAVEQWGVTVPQGTAYKLQVITGGRLQVLPELYRKARRST